MERKQRITGSISLTPLPHDGLHERFDRLRNVILALEKLRTEMPDQLLMMFTQEDLVGIEDLMQQHKAIQLRIELLQRFIKKWEAADHQDYVEVSKEKDG